MEEHTWKYEDYSKWSQQLAKLYTVEVLQKELDIIEGRTNIIANQHLNAIKKTSSMQSNSQRRAQSRNSMTANYEAKQAYRNAIELHLYYPNQCKK